MPYLNTRFFEFRFGNEAEGERLIDAQYWSSTEYVGLTMRGNATVFGVNFADGRIKGYPRDFGPRGQVRHFVRPVRGNPEYGQNRLVDNGDGTVSDQATGLMWVKADSGRALNWQQALPDHLVDRLASVELTEINFHGERLRSIWHSLTRPAAWCCTGTGRRTTRS